MTQLEGGFISSVTLGTVGALRRLQPFPSATSWVAVITKQAKANKMSPLSKLSKGPDGKFELTQLQATESVQVCVEFDGHSLADAYFEDRKTQQRFNVLSIDGVVSVNIGIYNGEGWYRWVWIWESTQEADEAWSQAPADIDKTIARLVQKINDYIGNVTRNAKPAKSKVLLDITPDLMSIGWEMTILDYTTDEVAKQYRLSKRMQKKRTE